VTPYRSHEWGPAGGRSELVEAPLRARRRSFHVSLPTDRASNATRPPIMLTVHTQKWTANAIAKSNTSTQVQPVGFCPRRSASRAGVREDH
jgi:hypothetical protein